MEYQLNIVRRKTKRKIYATTFYQVWGNCISNIRIVINSKNIDNHNDDIQYWSEMLSGEILHVVLLKHFGMRASAGLDRTGLHYVNSPKEMFGGLKQAIALGE